jgi:hypothetical protein
MKILNIFLTLSVLPLGGCSSSNDYPQLVEIDESAIKEDSHQSSVVSHESIQPLFSKINSGD